MGCAWLICYRYGDGFDIQQQIDDVVAHLQTRLDEHYQKEFDPDFVTRADEPSDARVDVCLYFIPPHRLKELDLLYMKRLSEHVALIPVIAKADTMTESELYDFKQHILMKYVVLGMCHKYLVHSVLCTHLLACACALVFAGR